MNNKSIEEEWKVAEEKEGKLIKIDKPACNVTLEIKNPETFDTSYEDYHVDDGKAGGILSDARQMLGREVTLIIEDATVTSISLSYV